MLLSFMLNLCDYVPYIHKIIHLWNTVWALHAGGVATLASEEKKSSVFMERNEYKIHQNIHLNFFFYLR